MKILSKLDNTGMIEEVADKRYVTDAEKSAWNGKADKTYVDNKVKTNVPSGAKFTDTVTTVNGKTGAITKADITALGIPAQDTVPDISGKADKTYVDNKVKTDVPAGAKFTDTIYTHPSTHPASMITGLPTKLPADGGTSDLTKGMIGDDTRTINSPPSEYMSSGSRYLGRAGWQTEFKNTSTLGVSAHLRGTYCYLETKNPWSDSSGGYPIQLAYGDGTPVWRIGTSLTAWGEWSPMNSGGDANTVSGYTVKTNVPAGAKFTDTVYKHPTSHPASMITGLPTKLPADGGNSDTVDGKHASDFVGLGDTIQNTNPFGGKKLYINTLDNALAAAHKKYFVVATLHKKVVNGVEYPKPINPGDITLPQWEDSPVVSTLDASSLFNNDYESSVTIPSDSYAKIRIDFNAKGTAYFQGYPYGTYYLSYYHTNTPDEAQVRCYNGFDSHGIGYKTRNFSDYNSNKNSSNYIQECTDNGNYRRREIEFIVFGHPNHVTRLSQIEWKLTRPHFSRDTPMFSNYSENKSYQTFRFGDQENNNVIINPNGDIQAKKLANLDGDEVAYKTELPTKLSELVKDISFDERYYTETEMNALLGNKVNNSQVLTNVPSGAKFTDTVTTINGKTGAISKADITALGIPAQDTVYTHPSSHPASMITESSTRRFVSDSEKSTWNSKPDTDTVTTINGKTGVISKADIVALGIPSQDTNTTYSEITTAEIDAGTSSTLRTLTGRRVKYILDKVQGWIGGLTKSDVGLSNVDNLSAASIRSGTTKANVGLSNVDNVKQMPISGGVLENYREKLTTISAASGIINLSLGNVFQHTPDGNNITYSITNAVSGQAHSFTLIINMGSKVGRLTFPASVKWQGGSIPNMIYTNKTYVLTFMTVDGGTTWLGMFGGEF